MEKTAPGRPGEDPRRALGIVGELKTVNGPVGLVPDHEVELFIDEAAPGAVAAHLGDVSRLAKHERKIIRHDAVVTPRRTGQPFAMALLSAREFRRWGTSLALFLPVIVLYLCEYLRGDGRSFTGFIQYDQAYYMANAREIFRAAFISFTAIRSVPIRIRRAFIFIFTCWSLALLQHVTGCDPGRLYVIFGFFAGLVCVRVAMALYEQVAGLETVAQKAGLVLFVWGGGVLALTGLATIFFAVTASPYRIYFISIRRRDGGFSISAGT